MSADSDGCLQQALTMSHQLLQLVKVGEIEQAMTMEADRFRLIRQGIAADPQESIERRIELLREIQSLDKEIESTGQLEQARITERLRLLRQGQKAGKAYKQGR